MRELPKLQPSLERPRIDWSVAGVWMVLLVAVGGGWAVLIWAILRWWNR